MGFMWIASEIDRQIGHFKIFHLLKWTAKCELLAHRLQPTSRSPKDAVINDSIFPT